MSPDRRSFGVQGGEPFISLATPHRSGEEPSRIVPGDHGQTLGLGDRQALCRGQSGYLPGRSGDVRDGHSTFPWHATPNATDGEDGQNVQTRLAYSSPRRLVCGHQRKRNLHRRHPVSSQGTGLVRPKGASPVTADVAG